MHMNEITTLADRAMLVTLKRGIFNTNVTDRDATKLVETTNQVTNVGKYKKTLFLKSSRFAKLKTAHGSVYTTHAMLTLPWSDEGPRLLSSANYENYCATMAKELDLYKAATQDFVAHYSQEVVDDKARLGAMTNDQDYPDADHIERKFYADLRFRTIGRQDDFRNGISPEHVRKYAEDLIEAEREAFKECVRQLLDPLTKARDTLAKPGGERRDAWHSTLITNIVEAAYRIPMIDITQDESLRRLCEQIKQTIEPLATDIDGLKDIPSVRAAGAATVKSQVDAIMANFNWS